MTVVERAVLDRLLSVDFDGVEALRAQGASRRPGHPLRTGPCCFFVDGERRLQSMELQWMTDVPPTEWPAPDELEIRAA